MKLIGFKTALAATALIASSFTFVGAQTASPRTPDGQMQREGMRGFGKMHRKGKRGFGEKHLLKRFAAELNITDAQRQTFQSIKERYKSQMQSQREQLRAVRPQPGVASTPDQIARLNQLRSELATQRANMRNEMLAVLTAEQRTRLQQLAAQAQQRREQFRELRRQRLQNRQAQPQGTGISL